MLGRSDGRAGTAAEKPLLDRGEGATVLGVVGAGSGAAAGAAEGAAVAGAGRSVARYPVRPTRADALSAPAASRARRAGWTFPGVGSMASHSAAHS